MPVILPGSIQGILFDLDNTLYDREAAFRRWLSMTIDQLLPDSSEAARCEATDRICAIDAGGYGSKADLTAYLADLHPSWQIDPDEAKERFYIGLLDEISLDPAVDRLLKTLETNGVPYGIVTNGSLRQQDKIDRLQLTSRASCILISEKFGCYKPDQPIFLAAAMGLGLSPGAILFVGDNPLADIGGAQRAGMVTAWLHRGQPWPEVESLRPPDHILDSLADLTLAG